MKLIHRVSDANAIRSCELPAALRKRSLLLRTFPFVVSRNFGRCAPNFDAPECGCHDFGALDCEFRDCGARDCVVRHYCEDRDFEFRRYDVPDSEHQEYDDLDFERREYDDPDFEYQDYDDPDFEHRDCDDPDFERRDYDEHFRVADNFPGEYSPAVLSVKRSLTPFQNDHDCDASLNREIASPLNSVTLFPSSDQECLLECPAGNFASLAKAVESRPDDDPDPAAPGVHTFKMSINFSLLVNLISNFTTKNRMFFQVYKFT